MWPEWISVSFSHKCVFVSHFEYVSRYWEKVGGMFYDLFYNCYIYKFK